ncbi:MAG: IMP dehydrogenase [Polyangiaceae bacterium]
MSAFAPRSLPKPRRFALGRKAAGEGRRDVVSTPLAFALFVAALVVVSVARGVVLRTALPIALAFAGIALVLRARRARVRRDEALEPTPPADAPTAASTEAPSAEAVPSGLLSLRRPTGRRFEGVSDALSNAAPRPRIAAERCLEIDDRALALANGLARTALLQFGAPFGMTLLSNRQRDRVVLALTSKAGSFLVGGRVSAAERRDAIRLLSRATVVSTDEVAFDAIGPDGLAIELSAGDLSALFDSLDDVDPGANDRLLLSDSTGSPLELDGDTLVIRGMLFDLSRPLEWKPLLFQESFGQSLALYQGTWIRQGSSEVVLVALLPPSVLDPNPLDFESAGIPDLDVRAMRDQRLMQATAGTPPPNDLRVAIDGIFMLPLRVALDAAPRPSVVPACELGR